MKVSKRTEEARELRITKPHIVFEDGFWFFFCPYFIRQAGIDTEALRFCDKLNKAKG